MGFFSDMAKSVAKGVMDAGKETTEYKMRYMSLDDEVLFYAYRKGKITEKTAAFTILKERGHDEEIIKITPCNDNYEIRQKIDRIRIEVERLKSR